MIKRMEISELIFKILAYFFLSIFAVFCLYPFVYALSASLSSRQAIEMGDVVLLPVGLQFDAYAAVFSKTGFWVSYANTLFVTFWGTIWAVGLAILGAYALAKKRLIFRRGFNFFLVFTMWFSAGLIPQYLNYFHTREILEGIGITDDKILVVLAMGMNAFNVVLLRNAFEGVPKEIEEAAIIDGATEFQLLTKVYIPMTKATIATVVLFFGLSRWNGYFWARMMVRNNTDWPLQVYIRDMLDQAVTEVSEGGSTTDYSPFSFVYAMIVCAIVPILIIYPYIQKYFAAGVNLGGVKE